MPEIAGRIFSSLIHDLFDVQIMGNLYRADYVERMIAIGLGNGFTLTSADWAGWDIESDEGIRIEIKQSAAIQTWTDRPAFAGKPAKGSFDVAPRTGYWADGGSKWIARPGRNADLYILAWHPVADAAKADHRNPSQWLFFVISSSELPPKQKTISRTVVEKRWEPSSFERLREVILAQIDGLKKGESKRVDFHL